MARKASTHRLAPKVQAALDSLSKVLGRPKNGLINEAVELYVQQKSREVELELEATLQALRACRERDPDFEESIGAFVSAEAEHGSADPVEGRPYAAEGPVQSEIQRLLHA
jgi:predicted DNA-binding protein